MKITSVFNDFTNTEFYLLGLFVLYLVVPFQTPHIFYNFLVNPIGLILLLCTVVYMFFSTPPILAIVYVLVVYELLRRDGSTGPRNREQIKEKAGSSKQYNYVTDPIKVESVNSKGTIQKKPMRPPKRIEETKEEEYALPVGDSLEELIVSEAAPIQYGSSGREENYKPISENKLGGSVF